MPRDPSGKYTLPENPVQGGTPILADWANTTTVDIETELTDSLSRSGKGGMQGTLKYADKDGEGTLIFGQSWVAEPTTGRYLASPGTVVEQVQGVDVMRLTTSGLEERRDGAWRTLSSQDAIEVPYDNTTSGLAATNVQAAIDELDGLIDTGYVTFAGDETITGSKTFTAAETRIDGDTYLGGSENKILGANRNALLWQDSGGLTVVGNYGNYTVLDVDSDEGAYHRWGSGGADFAKALNESNFLKLMQDKITDALFPVGAALLTADNVNPQSRFAGTWELVSETGVLTNVGTGPNTDLAGNSYQFQPGFSNGYYRNNLEPKHLPEHVHEYGTNLSGGTTDVQRQQTAKGSYNSGEGTKTYTMPAGGSGPGDKGEDFEVFPPSLGQYLWVRTA